MIDLTKRRAGILAHPTSLPGPHGLGDLGPGAYAFVDWLARAGQTLWQWLPTTPIGPGHSPYQSVSAFAGSPLMVALEPLVQQGWLPAPGALSTARADRADFDRAAPWRLQQLRLAAEGFALRATPQQHAAFAAWCEAESHWLDDYALFMALEQAHGGQPWWAWAAPLARRDRQALAAARKAHAEDVQRWKFTQWCFDTQLAALRGYAAERGIHLVGDLPIFIAHHSADCWTRPDLYEFDDFFQPTVVAGVPPDELGPEGQRWGNPIYRWRRMAEENYAWWTARVKRALTQADVFRIDHFRGFAEYWEIAASEPTAKVGRWAPGPGRALFDAIEQALGRLPIIAEDLGYITPDVVALREAFGFPGMKILQFAFGGRGDHEFLPHNYPSHCVVYSGTHDNDTALGWWDHAPAHERHYAGTYLACKREDVHWGMIRAACNSVAATAIFPLQDVLGLPASERMNTPGTLGGDNWAWRVRAEQLSPQTADVLAMITAASGRGPFEKLTAGAAGASGSRT